MKELSLLIWVQHLFGKGHVRRMARIAAACAEQGMTVTVVAGGPDGRKAFRGIENISVHQLPALRTKDHQYTGLITQEGVEPNDVFWRMRREALLEVLAVVKPDIVLVELFPFGRRKFSDEVLALIEAARALPNRPLIASSVRDIVEPKVDVKKSAEMGTWLSQCFDAVLVHGDESIIELGETAPFAKDAGTPLFYTGYIAPEEAKIGPKSGVVISAGSGLSGDGLLSIAAEAGTIAATAADQWHIFVPPKVDAPSSGKNPHVFVHPFGNTFEGHLAQAAVSISEAGYNTAAEGLALGAKLLLVPYGEAGQTEQPRRATRFAERGLAICLDPEGLDAARLIEAVGHAKSLPPPPALNLSGSSATPFILKDLREGGLAS